MELIIKNQPTIYDDTLYKYLTPKQCIKFYSSNLILYNIYVYNNRFKYYYFTPINNTDLIDKVGLWYYHREDTILRIWTYIILEYNKYYKYGIFICR